MRKQPVKSSPASRALVVDPLTGYTENEDDEYLDILWGIRRHPIVCYTCGHPTRLPLYHCDDPRKLAFCAPCYYHRQETPPPTESHQSESDRGASDPGV